MPAANSEQQQRIAAALRAARERLTESRSADPIAIVGIGCRFPGGVTDPDGLWDIVAEGIDATGEQPGDRWDIARFHDPDPDKPGTIYTTRGGFLDSVDTFDAEFFGISPREAHAMDPQQRLLLEIAWEALENAGIAPRRLRGSDTGLFVGLSWRDYDRVAVANRPEAMNAYAGLGNTPSIAVGRVAYALDLHGPVALVDTACSSALVAVHQAVQSLRNGDCSTALAGGVNLILSPLSTMFCCRIRALSPDGRCKTFDAAADGYGRAEGCGLVVLKRLPDAQRDGDRIYAVIRGSAVNHDGRTGGLTVPNAHAQEAVVRAALRVANVEPAQVNYIEAHGTGTALGDPIEIGALNSVFGSDRAPLWVGSVKSNFGHAETAAGVAGLIKAALAVQRAVIPPTLHVREPNPRIEWAAGAARVAMTSTAWPAGPRIAGVSSFGFSGTNAHLVVEQPPEPVAPADTPLPAGLLTLSARTPEALRAQARRYAIALRTVEPGDIEAFCATANLGRELFEHRLAVVAGTTTALAAGLDTHVAGTPSAVVRIGQVPRGAAVHTALLIGHRGPGVEPLDRESYAGSAAFRAAVDECLAATGSRKSFRTALFAGLAPNQAQRVPGLADALAFVHRYAMVRQLLALGLRPAAVLGAGIGEYVAAAISGILEPAAALRASVSPAQIHDERMVVRAAGPELLDEILAVTGARIHGRFGDRYLVSAGPSRRDELCDRLRAAGIAVTAHAELRDRVGSGTPVPAREPEFNVVSAHSGLRLGAEGAAAEYWSARPLWPAAVDRALDTLAELGCTVQVEVGGAAVLDLARARSDAGRNRLLTTGTARSEQIRAVAGLFAVGAVDDLRDLHGPRPTRITLPTYPFQRRRFWVDADALAVVPEPGAVTVEPSPVSDSPAHPVSHPAPVSAADQAPASETASVSVPIRDSEVDQPRAAETVPGSVPASRWVAARTRAAETGAVPVPGAAPVAVSEAELFRLRRRVRAVVTDSVRQVFQLTAADALDPDTPLQELGFDSLMAVELRNVLTRALALPVEAAFAFEFPTLTAQIAEITARLSAAERRPVPQLGRAGGAEAGNSAGTEPPTPSASERESPVPDPAAPRPERTSVPELGTTVETRTGVPAGPRSHIETRAEFDTPLDGLSEADLIALARAEVAALEEVLP